MLSFLFIIIKKMLAFFSPLYYSVIKGVEKLQKKVDRKNLNMSLIDSVTITKGLVFSILSFVSFIFVN